MTRQKRNARYRVLERRPVGSPPGISRIKSFVNREGGRMPVDSPAPHRLPGPGDEAVLCLLDQSVSSRAGEVAAIYNLAGKSSCSQMGQAAPEDQELSGDHGQCGDDAGLGGAVCLPAGGLREVSAAAPRAPVRDFQACRSRP